MSRLHGHLTLRAARRVTTILPFLGEAQCRSAVMWLWQAINGIGSMVSRAGYLKLMSVPFQGSRRLQSHIANSLLEHGLIAGSPHDGHRAGEGGWYCSRA